MKGAHWLVCLIACCACAGSEARGRLVAYAERGDQAAAYKLYESEGRPSGLLGAWAESLLLSAAHSEDPAQRRAAWNELQLLGTRARPWLEQLSAAGEPELTRAQALDLRLALGDADARAELSALAASRDESVVDLAYAALDPETDSARLESALLEPRSARRSAAVQVLGRVEPALLAALQAHGDQTASPLRAAGARRLAALGQVARFDPEPSLRAAALHALAPFGSAAQAVFESALNDPAELVRIAARDSLTRSDPDAAQRALDLQLGAAVSDESLAAACSLLRMKPAREPARAWALFTRALTTGEPAQRGRASTLLRSLPSDVLDRAWLRDHLAHESQPELQLNLSLALGSSDAAAAAALSKLLQLDAQPAVVAATELARQGSMPARQRLLTLRTHASPLVRAGAARALGRELHDAASIAALLGDTTLQVRLAAAGAVLSVM